MRGLAEYSSKCEKLQEVEDVVDVSLQDKSVPEIFVDERLVELGVKVLLEMLQGSENLE